MDKIAMYEALLADHPLWDDGLYKESVYGGHAIAAGGVGSLVGGGLGYYANRNGSPESRRRGLVGGAVLGGAIGLTGGEIYSLVKKHKKRLAEISEDHKRRLEEIKRDGDRFDRWHREEMKRLKKRGQDLDRLNRELKEKAGKMSLSELEDMIKRFDRL